MVSFTFSLSSLDLALGTLSHGLTYSCRTIVKITEEIQFEHQFIPIDHQSIDKLHTSGGYLKLGPGIYLSIQTNPRICGSAFAESYLRGDLSLEMFHELGYKVDYFLHAEKADDFSSHDDCIHVKPIRHAEQADLTAHLQLLSKTFPRPIV